jgi:hypothetical protein
LTAGGQLALALGAAPEVIDDLVLQFRLQLVSQIRIGYLSKIVATH